MYIYIYRYTYIYIYIYNVYTYISIYIYWFVDLQGVADFYFSGDIEVRNILQVSCFFDFNVRPKATQSPAPTASAPGARKDPSPLPLHSAKGGVVETGCSDLYNVIY